MNRLCSNALLIALSLWPAWLCAGPDPLQLAWLDRQGIVLHWDNVEGAPVQLGGAGPRYDRGRGLHVVTLQPGENVLLRLAAGERLRIQRTDGRPGTGDVELAWSNGSGLYVAMPLQLSPDGAALLSDAGPDSAGVVRITRPPGATAPVSVALFTSRHAEPASAVGYRDVIDIPGQRPLRLSDRNSAGDFWQLPGGGSVTLPVPADTRIRLETRLAFPASGDVAQQRYRLDVLLDGKPWRVLEFETTLDGDDPVAVDGCYRPVGQRLNGYLDIPVAAQRLELRSDAAVYLRLLGYRVADAYLWDGNRPRFRDTLTPGDTVAGQDVTQAQRLRMLTAPGRLLADGEQALSLLLQDNGWRDGGLTGGAWLRDMERDYPGEDAVRLLSERAWSLHTAYRELLPASQDVPVAQRFSWFRTPVPRDEQRHMVVPESYADSLGDTLAGGYFAELPAGQARRFSYRLPERAADSRLRLGVDRSGLNADSRIYLQFDDQPARQLQVMRQPDLPTREWQPGRAEAALAVLNHAHAARGATLAGPFAARNAAAPLTEVALLELPLPRDIRQLHIWRDDAQAGALRVAVQYRAGRYYQAAGSGYRSLLQALGPAAVYARFVAALSHGIPDPGAERSVTGVAATEPATGSQERVRALHNQWLPLLRLLQARSSRLLAAVSESPAGEQRGVLLVAAQIQSLQATAQRAQAEGDPVAELRAWTAIRHGSTGTTQQQAAMAQAELLERLGESYLAEQQLLGLFVATASNEFRAQLLERLLALYRRSGNDEARLNVLAAAVMRHPQPALLRLLAEALLEQGRTHYALQVALALPPAERPAGVLLQASYAAGWWALFDEQLAGIRDPDAYRRWAGWRAQATGNYTQALSHWRAAGATAAALRAWLADGMDIRTRLGATGFESRRQALRDWERWQAGAPGAHGWQDEPQLVTAHAGAETLHVIEQDRYVNAFRATPAIPVTLQVYGPVTLRLSLRPLHAATDTAPINDWVSVEDGAQQTPFPVTDNRVAGGLLPVGAGQSLPGLAETVEYRVAPGLHEIHVTPEQHPLLLQVAAARPVLPLAVLPPLSPATVRAALQGDLGDSGPVLGRTGPAAIEVVQQCGVMRLETGYAMDAAAGPAPEPGLHAAPQSPDTAPEADTGGLPAAREPDFHVVRRDETLSGIALRYGQGYRQLARLNGIDPPYVIRAGQRLRLGTPADGAADPHTDPLAQLRGILWTAEHDAAQTVAMAAAGEALFQQHAQLPGMQDLWRRLRRLTGWEAVSTVQASAGVRVLDVPSGSPEDPALRLREALLPAPLPGEQLLSGFETLVFAVDQPAPARFRVDLSMADLVPLQAQPMQVLLQLDDAAEQPVRLTPAQPRQRISRRIPGGSHLLRVRIAGPVLNQYLRVAIRDQGAVSGGTVASWTRPRNYHVATREEPVILSLEGPTRVRIDELRAGRTLSSYRNLAAGWQQVRLEPRPQQPQALFRIHRLVVSQPAAQVPARLPVWTPTGVPEAVLHGESTAPRRGIIDRFAPGGQEDGTWSLESALLRRRNVDEDGAGDDRAEQFAELSATHRYFAGQLQSYFRSELLARLRAAGGPTLGVREWIDVDRPDWPLDIALSGSLYTQRPDAEAGSQWAASVRGALSRQFEITPRMTHRPVISVFQRWLSLDDSLPVHPERVDQDLFTHYKNDHRRGLGVADTLGYHPWLDTLWYATLGVASNEDLNVLDPDHAELALGARQLLQNWQVSAEYQARHYFPDRDRNGEVTRQRYQLSLDWLGWHSDRRGLQGRVQLAWDDASQAFSGLLSVAWVRSNARFYRDFSPAELGFKTLRERQLQEQFFTGSGVTHGR